MSGKRGIAGMILSAGLGTRMLPLTERIPKALLPVTGVPLFEVVAEKLLREGASVLHANLHHLGDLIEEYAGGRGWPLAFHREEELLDTGGGIGNMGRYLAGGDTILVHNADVITNITFAGALDLHRERGALVTMVLTGEGGESGGRFPPHHVTVSAGGEVTGIGEEGPVPGGSMKLGFTGMTVISGEALEFFPAGRKAGLVEILNLIIREVPGGVAGYAAGPVGDVSWGETGSPASWLDIHRRILLDKEEFDPLLKPPPLPLRTGNGASISPSARWEGFLDIGRNATVEKLAFLRDCIVMDGTTVREGTERESAILYPGGEIGTGRNG